MNVEQTGVQVVPPKVYTSSHGGLSSDQLADITVNKIIYADAGTIAPEIYQQAMMFRTKIKAIIIGALASARRAALSDYVYEAERAGMTEVAKALRERIANGNF